MPYVSFCLYLDKYSPYSFNAQTLPLLQKYEHCLRYYSNRLSSDEDVLFFGVFFVFFVFFFSFFLLSGWSEFFFEDGDDAKIVVVVVSDFAD